MKTNELSGAALDWAVAKCERGDYCGQASTNGIGMEFPATNYSTNWCLAGPIIDHEGISILRCDDDYGVDAKGFTTRKRIPVWAATPGQHGVVSSTEHQSHDAMFQVYEDQVVYGPTALVAAMRCLVSSKLGAEVGIPKELL